MATQKKIKEPVYTRGIVNNEVGDHSKDPFVIKKVEAAKKRLERIKLPEGILKKK